MLPLATDSVNDALNFCPTLLDALHTKELEHSKAGHDQGLKSDYPFAFRRERHPVGKQEDAGGSDPNGIDTHVKHTCAGIDGDMCNPSKKQCTIEEKADANDDQRYRRAPS